MMRCSPCVSRLCPLLRLETERRGMCSALTYLLSLPDRTDAEPFKELLPDLSLETRTNSYAKVQFAQIHRRNLHSLLPLRSSLSSFRRSFWSLLSVPVLILCCDLLTHTVTLCFKAADCQQLDPPSNKRQEAATGEQVFRHWFCFSSSLFSPLILIPVNRAPDHRPLISVNVI